MYIYTSTLKSPSTRRCLFESVHTKCPSPLYVTWWTWDAERAAAGDDLDRPDKTFSYVHSPFCELNHNYYYLLFPLPTRRQVCCTSDGPPATTRLPNVHRCRRRVESRGIVLQRIKTSHIVLQCLKGQIRVDLIVIFQLLAFSMN